MTNIRIKLKILNILIEIGSQEEVFSKVTELEKLVGVALVGKYLGSIVFTDKIILEMEEKCSNS